MTIVVARKFGQRVIILSDTMISDRDARSANIFPGRLKSIVINTKLTIAYAGLSAQALDAIRKVHANNLEISLESVIQFLEQTSKTFYGELDFLVCAHNDKAQLWKISCGITSTGSDFYWIGNAQAASELSRVKIYEPEIKGILDYLSAEEIYFVQRFHTYLSQSQCVGVGGAVINCLCSEYGHCYQNQGAGSMLCPITIASGNTVQQEDMDRTGMYRFDYNVYSSHERGRSIVGIFLSQADLGFIHSPLVHDDAIKVFPIEHSAFAALIGGYK